MKSITKFLGLLLSITVVLTSCSDDKDNRSKYQFNGVCRHSVNIKGFANDKVTTNESVISINDLLIDYDYAPPIIAGELFMTEVTSIKITNLEGDIILRDFILTINDRDYKFDRIDRDNTNLYTNKTMDYFRDVFNRMVSQRKLRVKMSYTPNRDIIDENNIKIEIVFNGKFTYKK